MPRRPVPAVALAGLAALALALSACNGDAAEPQAVEVQDSAVASPSAVPDGMGSTPPAPPSVETSAPAPSSPASSSSSSPAASSAPTPTYDVAAAQRTLADGGYYAGAVDGRPGPALRSAVMAFQKVQGLGADGVVGPATLRALAAPRAPVLRATSPASRVEVDLTKQVLYVVEGGRIERVMPVSSGNGATYRQKSGGTARALTPVGWYTVQRRIVGERKADLGSLYDPEYFYKGWAIHGSNSVPAVPASHGCVRVTRADAKYLLSHISVGTKVYLYGGTHTFTAGSGAPGTDSPTGDTPQDAPAEPTAAPSPVPSRPAPSSAAPSRPAPTSPAPTSPAPTSPAPTSAAPTSPAPTSPAPSSAAPSSAAPSRSPSAVAPTAPRASTPAPDASPR